MREFQILLTVLEDELQQQERLLELLGHERAAIVKLQQEQLEALLKRKEALLEEVKSREEKRIKAVRQAFAAAGKDQTAEPVPPMSAVIAECPSNKLRSELEKARIELKKAAEAVAALNSSNGELLRQSLGLVSSTLAIVRNVPGTELPTYGEQGKLKADEDPGFARRSKTITREA